MDTVLVFGGLLGTYAALGDARRMGEGEIHLALTTPTGEARRLAIIAEQEVGRALRRLTARRADVVVVDARNGHDVLAEDFLTRLFPLHEVGGPGRRQRTVVLVDGSSAGARVAYLAGTLRIASVHIAPTDAEVLARMLEMTAPSQLGKTAICLAGGGIEGLLYEVGVLRAIEHFLEGRSVCDLDLFFGISAGSVLAAFLANGLTPQQIADGLRRGTDKLDRLTRRDIFDPNVREVGQRLMGLVRDLVGMGDARNAVSALYRAIPNGAFAGNAIRSYMLRQLSRPHMSDHFDDLRRPLFIGATDQDAAEAVVFGEQGWRDVPVHKAVRASCALIPFFTPEKIGGRYYIDGAFTRTTNMRVAVKHGASLVMLIDPLVPIRTHVAGYVRKKGGLFSTMQALKSLINGRFDKAEGAIREMYPDVAFHLLRPEGDEMRILSGSPMKFLYRTEIEDLAYQRTLRKIRRALPEMSRDFARHGIVFREPPPRPSGTNAFEDGLVVAA